MNREEDELSDEFLIEAIAGGAMWAFERLHQRYGRRFYRLAYRMTSDHMVTEELVQDTFFAVWQSAASYAPQTGPARRWLFSIIYHRIVNHLRHERSHATVHVIPLQEVEAYEHFALADVWEQAWATVQSEELWAALQQLPAEQRAVIGLSYFEEWTHGEIARRCNIPLGTVKARIRLGVQHLKQILEQTEREQRSSCKMLFSRTTNRWQTSPRQAATVVVQRDESGCAAGYELCQDGSCGCFKYTQWEHLVEQIETFEFRGTAGNFTARKGRRARGEVCWYASTWGSAGKRNTYLGRPAHLTLARLEAMAKKLHEG